MNDEDEDSNTALHLACTNKRAIVAEKLLEFGADVQSRNAKKWTPLDCAAAVGALKCAKILLEVGLRKRRYAVLYRRFCEIEMFEFLKNEKPMELELFHMSANCKFRIF